MARTTILVVFQALRIAVTSFFMAKMAKDQLGGYYTPK
jgi:hypothetical protein